MNKIIIFLIIAAAVLYGAYIYQPDLSSLADKKLETNQERIITMENGLKIEDLEVGTGEEAVAGKQITVHYTGTLEDGTKFDSSLDRGTPFSFTLGAGSVIQGWEQGFEGMKVGGKRKLTIPSDLGYGDVGAPPTIPGGATLIFEVELLEIK